MHYAPSSIARYMADCAWNVLIVQRYNTHASKHTRLLQDTCGACNQLLTKSLLVRQALVDLLLPLCHWPQLVQSALQIHFGLTTTTAISCRLIYDMDKKHVTNAGMKCNHIHGYND